MVTFSALVVDDDATLVEALAAQFRRMGASVDSCLSHTEALAYLAEHQPTVMVVDVKLPDGDGLDLCLHPNLDDALRLVITGHPSAQVSARCHRLGAQLLLKTGDLWRQARPLVQQHLGMPQRV